MHMTYVHGYSNKNAPIYLLPEDISWDHTWHRLSPRSWEPRERAYEHRHWSGFPGLQPATPMSWLGDADRPRGHSEPQLHHLQNGGEKPRSTWGLNR